MPVLCSFTDLHSVSLMLYKSPTEYWFKSYPYVYSKTIFSSSFTKEAFYTALFLEICAEHGVDLATCDIALTGFLEAPRLKIESKFLKSLYEVVAAIKDVYPILVNNTSIFTPQICHAVSAIKHQQRIADFIDSDEENYYANLEIYPQIITNEVSTQIDLDSNVVALLDEDDVIPNTKPLVLGGTRFTKSSPFPELDYLLILNLLRVPGMYEIKKDEANSLILSTLLSMYDPKAQAIPAITRTATVIYSPDALECMTQTSDGTSQLVELEKGKVMVLPVSENERVKLMIKSHSLGTIERTIVGGGIGIVLDTRVERQSSVSGVAILSSSLKSFREALSKKGL